MRTIRLTKEGWRFLLAVALIGIASLSTSNNLIYLIFSMMLSLSFISLAIAFVNLRKLSCEIDFRETLYANVPFRMHVQLDNRKGIPSYSVSLGLPFEIASPLYVPIVKKGINDHDFEDVVINKRGKYSIESLRLQTGFPFIFMYYYKTINYGKEIIVYPELIDVKRLISNIAPDVVGRETIRRGQEGDYLYAREYQYGEESRNIDWKATAKIQKTMVREYSRRDDRLATIILDNSMTGNEVLFEKSVSTAASLCSEFIGRGYYVRLISCRKVVPFGHGQPHMLKILDILAEVERVRAIECPISESLEGMSILVVSSDISGFAPIASQCSGVIDARNI